MTDHLTNINDKQLEAIKYTGSPILIFAGAGSGKTRVLTNKIAYLVQDMGLPPEHVLAVTFTNKAAGEMKNRVQTLLPTFDVSTMNVGTFHSICARLLRKEIYLLDYTPGFTIYDQDDSGKAVKNVIKILELDPKLFNHKNIQYQISSLKNKMVTPEDYSNATDNYRELKIADIYKEYQKLLKDNNSVDFDDLLLLPLEIFKKYPDKLKNYQEKYQYILVDEYQDTNKPQFEFIYALAKRHREICVVGDDDQSIYGWRGADIQNILDFENAFPKSKVIKLEQNYRSTPTILNAAYHVVSQNLNRADKKLWTENSDGEEITILETENELDEARKIIKSINSIKSKSDYDFKDFAILYRTNAQSRVIEDSLRRRGIPYIIIGGIKFYDRKEVKDILAYLRIIVNSKDTINLERVLNFPPRGIGQTTLKKLITESNNAGISLFELISNVDQINIGLKQRFSINEFYSIISKYKQNLSEMSASNLVKTLIEDINLEKYYKNQNTEDAIDRWMNVNEVINSIVDFNERFPKSGLPEFLEEVALLSDIDNWNESSNAVTLMTLHSAKGLEFPVVIITGLEEGLFPLYSSMDNPEELEEERRLFYVGVTRAEKKVILGYANNRRRYNGEQINCIPSRFISEIPEKYLNYSDREIHSPVKKPFTYKPITQLNEFYVGELVVHKVFGKGKIQNVEGSGGDSKLTILFSGNVPKKFMAKYANLIKV